MITTSVFIVPLSAQAEQYPILPIPGTISTQCLTNESKYVSGNEKAELIIHIMFQVQVHFD